MLGGGGGNQCWDVQNSENNNHLTLKSLKGRGEYAAPEIWVLLEQMVKEKEKKPRRKGERVSAAKWEVKGESAA